MAKRLNRAIPTERRSLPRNRQHSIARSVVLHLLPGALITTFYIGVAPVVRDFGFPALMALYLAIAFVLIPFELGYLFYRARTEGVPLSRVVLYREHVPGGQLVGLVLITSIWASLTAMLLFPPLDEFFIDTFFFWLPDWFFMAEDFAQYSAAALLITWVFGLLANGIAGPMVEELYFRGYLLPRIARLGGWAPLLNMVLFSLYHFFTPWANIGRIVALLPMVYATWWKRNIYLGIAVHVLWNIGGMLLLLAIFVGSGGSGS
jgi:membrane protease YdiL (CAAX protease family)